MGTTQIVFMAVTLFVGLLQFITSKMVKNKKGATKRDITQNYYIRQWGRNSIVFAGFMMPFYYFGPDKTFYIVIIFFGLLIYNAYLLKKGIRRVNQYYPANDPNGEIALAKKNEEMK